ncbi:MAG: MFS transporter [Opitutae bacterium]|nr:MFS transporter [Opitutae bacterium]
MTFAPTTASPTAPPTADRTARYRPWLWVPSLYLAMGIPFNVINGTASSMFKALGIGDAQNTVALGSVIVVWSLKPFWAAFLDRYRTKKFHVLAMETLLAVLFAGVALALPLPGFFRISLALLWVAAFASATQDICGDGLYLAALAPRAQARLAGIQGMCWNLGKVLATGVLIAGLERLAHAQGWSQTALWMAVWLTAAAALALLAVYHVFFLPPGGALRPAAPGPVFADFLASAATVFHKRSFWGMIAFILLYRLGEGLLLVEGKLFLQSSVASGGLGLTPGQVAGIDAVWGTIASIAGGILGGLFLARLGLRRALPLLGLCLNLPHLTFVYLSHAGAAGHGLGYSTVALLVSIEKFGYGFGFIGNMVYMMQQFAPGRCTMTHYAFATALMNLVLAPTTMVSGPLAEALGFSTFFLVVLLASVPSVWVAWRAPFPLAADGPPADDAPPAGGNTVTADDPTRVGAAQRRVQELAGRASACALLNLLAILLLDARALGAMAGGGSAWLPLGALAANAVLKIFLTARALRLAGEAERVAAQEHETVYRRNARGARVVTVLCAAASLAILLFAARFAA